MPLSKLPSVRGAQLVFHDFLRGDVWKVMSSSDVFQFVSTIFRQPWCFDFGCVRVVTLVRCTSR